jgi:hypothetical protein
MRHRLWMAMALAAALAGLVFSATVMAAPPERDAPRPALSGRIQEGPFYDSAGTPSWEKLRVDVNLIDASGRVVASVTPDRWGEFRFAQVRPATYTFSFTYPSLNDPVHAERTYTRSLTWSSRRVAYEVFVDINPYTNTPSYEQVTRYERCPGKSCEND